MNNNDVTKVIEEQLAYCRELLVVKGKEYADDNEDRLQLFKRAANLQGMTPEQALAGMMCKHTISVYDLIANEQPYAPIWDEKITDSINYLLLLKCLLIEEDNKKCTNNNI